MNVEKAVKKAQTDNKTLLEYMQEQHAQEAANKSKSVDRDANGDPVNEEEEKKQPKSKRQNQRKEKDAFAHYFGL